MKVTKNQVVSIHYKLSDDQGNEIDASTEGKPLVYLHGNQNIIPGLEKAINDKNKGDKFTATVSPEEAYGKYDENMVKIVPKTEFEDASKIAVGTQFEVKTEEGAVILSVIEVRDQEIVLDGNHPLAGVTLQFDIEIVDLRDATEEEIAHGHVHGPEDHKH